MADRIAQIDGRLNEIGIREQATQNEQLLILLAQERLALTNERISLTLPPAPSQGGYFALPLFSWFSFSAGLFRYRCSIINGRLKKCNRAKIFQITEEFLGYKCNNASGIGVEGHNISVDVCFKEESRLLLFQSALRRQCGKKRRLDDNQDQYASIVCDEILSRVFFYRNLVRIFGDDYRHADNEDDGNNSPLCDLEGDTLSIFSAEVANINEAEVRVQMIEIPGRHNLFGQEPEVCHIKDKALCNKTSREHLDTNNHLYMSRQLHQHFDGIETIPKKTPSFLIRYLSHDDALIDCPVWDDAYVLNPVIKRQKVLVEIVFRDRAFCNHLQVFLRNGSTQTSDRVYQMELFFENAIKARGYLNWKADKTVAKWAEVDIDCPPVKSLI